jgi:hypothetical protein
MPKKKEEIKEETPIIEKQDGVITEVASMLASMQNTLLEEIKKVNDRVDEITAPKPTFEPEVVLGESETTSTTLAVDNKVPSDILELVHKMISPKCGVKVEDSPSTPTFMVHVTVPSELSKEPQPDVRSKSIKYSEGLPKIKEWLTLVKKNIWTEFNKAGESVPPQS